MSSLAWYGRRLIRMSPRELTDRVRDQVVRAQLRRQADAVRVPTHPDRMDRVWRLPDLPDGRLDGESCRALVQAADGLMEGRWSVFGVSRTDVDTAPDWFLDVRTGRRAPAGVHAFDIDIRNVETVGDPKYVWELSRHQHLTVLAAAHYLTGDRKYAERAAAQMRHWWAENYPFTGIHWTSGIELGLRLVSWAWIRRLLAGWPGTAALFEENPTFACQLWHHQRYLRRLPSHGSSANNHAIAELTGLLVSAYAFPLFDESRSWRTWAEDRLWQEATRQTFASGLNRELAAGYHMFVLELLLVAAVEAVAAGQPPDPDAQEVLVRMADAWVATLDGTGRPPRHGDDDDGVGLQVDAPTMSRETKLLASLHASVEPAPWWPTPTDAIQARVLGEIGFKAVRRNRPRAGRPDAFPDAGVFLLRTHIAGEAPEIWCRCDCGPLGFLRTAAHGHADALSVELRVDGVDVLADPGTYLYHHTAAWRAYFRGTRAHNTLEVEASDQAPSGGRFLWMRDVPARLLEWSDEAGRAVWSAQHEGYHRLGGAPTHVRRVELDRAQRRLTIVDRLTSRGLHDCRIHFHLGPTVECSLEGPMAHLSWIGPSGPGQATMELPAELLWTVERGRHTPPVGWYSPRYGEILPATTLTGEGRMGEGRAFVSHLDVGAPGCTGGRRA